MRPRSEYEEVDRWIRWGLNDTHASRLTAIPLSTVRHWRSGDRRSDMNRDEPRTPFACPRCSAAVLDEGAYAYLLGLYLGDGHIARCRRTCRLDITCDLRYPRIIDECDAAIHAVRPGGRIGRHMKTGCVNVVAYWSHWPCLFPQHGPGRKHERQIRLQEWQLEIVNRHPDRLLRGLVHSDGSRSLNRVKGHAYPRYQFTNESSDIRGIFCGACDAFGVAWRVMRRNAISVARGPDVAKLDSVIGPKA